MKSNVVPLALQNRLGTEAADALVQFFERSRAELREDVITACTERFERRLVEEVAGLRVQIAQIVADLRVELRTEVRGETVSLRREMDSLKVDLSKQVSEVHVSLLRWAFVFWIGQVIAIAALLNRT